MYTAISIRVSNRYDAAVFLNVKNVCGIHLVGMTLY